MAMALQVVVVVVVVVRRQWMSPVWTSELAGSSRHGSIPTLTPYMWRKVREDRCYLSQLHPQCTVQYLGWSLECYCSFIACCREKCFLPHSVQLTSVRRTLAMCAVG